MNERINDKLTYTITDGEQGTNSSWLTVDSSGTSLGAGNENVGINRIKIRATMVTVSMQNRMTLRLNINDIPQTENLLRFTEEQIRLEKEGLQTQEMSI